MASSSHAVAPRGDSAVPPVGRPGALSRHLPYRPGTDGLRAVAVLSVVAFHAFPERLPGGYVGVDIFFVISGFLISTIIYKGLSDGSFSFSQFYGRRIRCVSRRSCWCSPTCYGMGFIALHLGGIRRCRVALRKLSRCEESDAA